MSESVQYMVKDAAGNIYGPASIEMLRQWIGERRIIGSMSIAPQGTEDWQLVCANAELADVLKSPAPLATATSSTAELSTAGGSNSPQAVTYNPNYATPAAYRGPHALALWSMICGIFGLAINGLSLVCCLWILVMPVSFVASIAAVIMGYMALKKIGNDPTIQGRGMAWAGIVTGLCGILLILVMVVGGLIMFGMSIFSAGHHAPGGT